MASPFRCMVVLTKLYIYIHMCVCVYIKLYLNLWLSHLCVFFYIRRKVQWYYDTLTLIRIR